MDDNEYRSRYVDKFRPVTVHSTEPGPRVGFGYARAEDLPDDGGPRYQPLIDAFSQGRPYEERVVPAKDLRIERRFRIERRHPGGVGEQAIARAVAEYRTEQLVAGEFMTGQLIPVMERSDGSLWVYDDCLFVEATVRVDPDTPVPCAVFKDPTR